jgi:hypothetical protein
MSDLKNDFVNEVPPIAVIDDTECSSPGCRIDDCLKFGDSDVGGNFLSKKVVKCLGNT